MSHTEPGAAWFSRDLQVFLGGSDVLQSRYKGLVKKEYSDPTYVVVSQLFRHLIGKEMTPPSETYKR